MDLAALGQVIGGAILALGAGGGTVHAYHRRRANGSVPTSHAQEEVLRQSLHDQRHGETMRVLESVSLASASAATASKSAAESCQRIAITIDERLPRRK